MIYPGCLGHLFSAGGKASWSDDTFLQLHRRPGRGDSHWVTLDQLRSGGINSSLRCAHDIPNLGFIKLSTLSCWKQPLKVFFNDFPPSFPLFYAHVILNWILLNFLTFLSMNGHQKWTLVAQRNILSCSYLGFPLEIERIMTMPNLSCLSMINFLPWISNPF